jgi:hypothetical protein
MKVKVDTAFYRDLTMAAIHALGEYHQVMESQLEALKTEDRNKIPSHIKNLVLDEEQKMAEWDIAMDEHTAKYDMLFRNFFRYSFVVLVNLFVESSLRELCCAVQDLKEITERVPNPRSNIIEKRKKFLCEAGVSVSQELWEPITTLTKVRNCIIHASGKVSRSNSKDEQYLREVAKQGLGILISDIYSERELHALYREGDMLVLEAKYCTQIVEDIAKLFELLCDAAGLGFAAPFLVPRRNEPTDIPKTTI